MSQITKIQIPLSSESDAQIIATSLGELESNSSGLGRGNNGITLYTAVTEFLSSSPKAKQAQVNVEVAEENAAQLADALFRHLVGTGFDCQLLVCHGFKGELVDCSPVLTSAVTEFGRQLIAKDLIHFVVRVGNVVIDLAFKRFGSRYLNSNNTVFNMFKSHWDKIEEVPRADKMSKTDFLRFVRNALSRTSLKQLFSRADEPAPMLGGFAIATASSVVGAFGKATRNRRTRKNQG